MVIRTPRAANGEEAAADRPDQLSEGPHMDRQVVSGPDLPPPIGPYSHAVRAGGFVFVSGQPGIDPVTGEVPGDAFGAEARQAFTNLATVLGVAGSRPDLKLGICGEHGGDPDSVHFFHEVGLDYVSCSPFRVPVARLEAGRSALGGT